MRSRYPGASASLMSGGRNDVGEAAGALVPGDGGLEAGGDGHGGDQREHDLGGVVGHGTAVAAGEPVAGGSADHVGQYVGVQFGGHGLPVAAGVGGGAAGRRHGGDLPGEIVAGGLDVFGGVPGVGRVGEVGVVRPEDRPHHRVPGPVDLPPAVGVGGQFGGGPHAGPGPGPQDRVGVGDLQHDRVDQRAGEAVLRVLGPPAGQVRRGPVRYRRVDQGEQGQVDVEGVGGP